MSTETAMKTKKPSSRRGLKGPYNLFFDDLKKKLSTSDAFTPGTKKKDIAKYIAAQWRNLDVATRAIYEIRAIDEEKNMERRQAAEKQQQQFQEQQAQLQAQQQAQLKARKQAQKQAQQQAQLQAKKQAQLFPPTTTSSPAVANLGGQSTADLKPKAKAAAATVANDFFMKNGVGRMLAAAEEQRTRRKMEDEAISNELKMKNPSLSSRHLVRAAKQRNKNPLLRTIRQVHANAGANAVSNHRALLQTMPAVQCPPGSAPQTQAQAPGFPAYAQHPEAAATAEEFAMQQQLMEQMPSLRRNLIGTKGRAPDCRLGELAAVAARREASQVLSEDVRQQLSGSAAIDSRRAALQRLAEGTGPQVSGPAAAARRATSCMFAGDVRQQIFDAEAAAAAAEAEAEYYEEIAAHRHSYPRVPFSNPLEMEQPFHPFYNQDIREDPPLPGFLKRRSASKFAKAGVPTAALVAADRAARAAYDEAIAAATAASEVAASVYEETLMTEMEVALAQRAAARRHQRFGMNPSATGTALGPASMPRPSSAAARHPLGRDWDFHMPR